MTASDHLSNVQFLPTNKVRFLGLPVHRYSGERGTKEYMDNLTEDIRQNGIKEPLTVGRVHDWSSLKGEEDYKGPATHLIADGAHRLKAAKRLGIKELPVRVQR